MAAIDQQNSHMATESSSDGDIIEIRLSDIISFLKRSRRAMLVGALAGGIIGAIYAFSKPNEFTSQITVLPEIQGKAPSSLGNLGSLAGLAGIDLGSVSAGNDAIRPELYPNVLQSIPFALNLLKKSVYVKEFERTQMLETYLTEKYKSPLTNLFSFGSNSEATEAMMGDTTQALRMTKEQEALTKSILDRVAGTYEKKSGILTISSTMPDPIVAANVVRYTLTYLTDYITTYRTEKARREVDFLNRQVSSAKQRYQAAEYALSAYRDQNRSIYLNTAKIEEQRIQAEFLLAQDLYNTLSKQSELAKIKVQEETPVFKVLEPARVPLRKSGPKRTVITLICFIIGSLVGLCINGVRIYRNRNESTV